MDLKRMWNLKERIQPAPVEQYVFEIPSPWEINGRTMDNISIASSAPSERGKREEKPPPQEPPPLYIICLERASNLFRTRHWKESNKDPDSILSREVKRDLWLSVLNLKMLRDFAHGCIDYYTEMVAKNDLQHLDMRKFGTDGQNLILTMLTKNGCRNLKTLLFAGCSVFDSNDGIEAVVRLSYNLEELHYPRFVNLDAFENCKKLRRLRFFRLENRALEYFQDKDPKFPESLKNLEVLGFSWVNSKLSVSHVISRILEECPNLVSVGSIDSSGALELIRQKNVDIIQTFKLKRCFWSNEYHQAFGTNSLPLAKSRQFSVIKNAVAMCPLVETLVIKIKDPTCLFHLKQLKNLSALNVIFLRKNDKNLPELISLLKMIGPQLMHLRIEDKPEIAADDIFRYCSNLQSLNIPGTMNY